MLIVTATPGAQQAREVVVAQLASTTRSLTFDSGHTVSGICVARELGDQRRILVAAHAVVDALDLQHVERLADVRRRALLAGVRDRVQARAARRLREHARELARRVAALAGVEPDADEVARDTAARPRASRTRRPRTGGAGSTGSART